MLGKPWKLHMRFCLESQREIDAAAAKVREVISEAGGTLSNKRDVTDHGQPDDYGNDCECTVTGVDVLEAIHKLREVFPEPPLGERLSVGTQYNNYGPGGKGLGLVIHGPAQQ